MARATLSLDAEQIGLLGIRQYLGDPRIGASALQPGQGGFINRAHDLRPVWPHMRAVCFAMAKELYETGGASGNPEDEGIPWEPNKGAYGYWKAATMWEDRPGILSGWLRNQLTGTTPGHYEHQTYTRFTFGSDAPVSKWLGRRLYAHSDKMVPEGAPAWSLDALDEDVGGMMAEGGRMFRDADDIAAVAGPTHPRPPLSVSEAYQDAMVDIVEDYVTGAPRVRGAFSLKTRQFTGMLRRIAGTPLIAHAGRVFKLTASGRRRRIGTI